LVNKSKSLDDQPSEMLLATKSAKRKQISSNIKSNSVIEADKNKTVDSDEETNKQKVSDETTEVAKSLANIIFVSKKRTQISSLEQSYSEIVEDKDKSPTNEEPVEKSPKTKKSINSDYNNRNKDKIKENNDRNNDRNKEKRKENNDFNKEKRKEKYDNSKEEREEKNRKKKEEENQKDLVDNTKDKLLFDKNYKIQINFQSCAICGYDSGLNNMKFITEEIETFFVSCGLQKLYYETLERFEIENWDKLYVSQFKEQICNKGVLNYHDYICRKCYEIIKPKKIGKKKKTNCNKEKNKKDDEVIDKLDLKRFIGKNGFIPLIEFTNTNLILRDIYHCNLNRYILEGTYIYVIVGESNNNEEILYPLFELKILDDRFPLSCFVKSKNNYVGLIIIIYLRTYARTPK
jgi:hypothetical protein